MFTQPGFAQTTIGNKTNATTSRTATKQARFFSTGWNMTCQPNTATNKVVCRLSRAVLIRKTRQLLARITVSQAPHRLILQLPHGLDLQAGAKIQIDENPVQTLPFRTSSKQGIFTNKTISSQLLLLLLKGKTLKITITAAAGRKITMPIALEGFAIAFEKMN